MKIPDASHPITIAPAMERVRITHGGKVIADSRHAIALKEASYPVVHYIPRDEVDFSALTRTTHASHCPYKGDASYYSVEHQGGRSDNAIWTYEAPYPAVAEIAGYLAFYPQRVDKIELLPLSD
jgi:uncharacterized protein (DUF427 family)